MEKKVEINGINMTIGRKELSLTIDEAKKLHAALSELFKEKVVHEVKEVHHHDHTKWWWTKPYYTFGQWSVADSTGNKLQDYVTKQLSATYDANFKDPAHQTSGYMKVNL